MNTPNPYAAGVTGAQVKPWRIFDLVVAGLWIAIPVGVGLGRYWVEPIFTDFGVQLPAATQLAMRPFFPVLLAIIATVVIVAVFNISKSNSGRMLVSLAFGAGLLVALMCLVSFLIPLFSLYQNLN